MYRQSLMPVAASGGADDTETAVTFGAPGVRIPQHARENRADPIATGSYQACTKDYVVNATESRPARPGACRTGVHPAPIAQFDSERAAERQRPAKAAFGKRRPKRAAANRGERR